MSKLHTFFGEHHQDWIEIEFTSWGNHAEDAQLFEQVKQAILVHQYMEISYSGNQGTIKERKIKPCKLCFKNQAWYLYAYCCLRQDYRFFKLKRMSKVRVLDTYFEPEKIGRVLPDADKSYSENMASTQVTLEISPDMAFRAYEELPDIKVEDSGNLSCTIAVTDINWFTSYVLSYGSHMQVLEPPEIKQKVMQEIEAMKLRYMTFKEGDESYGF